MDDLGADGLSVNKHMGYGWMEGCRDGTSRFLL